jgi:hypothetical protein
MQHPECVIQYDSASRVTIICIASLARLAANIFGVTDGEIAVFFSCESLFVPGLRSEVLFFAETTHERLFIVDPQQIASSKYDQVCCAPACTKL